MSKSGSFIQSVHDTYEKILIGEKRSFTPYFFEIQNKKDTIIILIKYLVEEKLKTTPDEALKIMTNDLLAEYKLSMLLKYAEKEILPEFKGEEAKFLIYYAYQGDPRYKIYLPSQEELTIDLYKKILDGKLKNFPKNYFLDGLKGEKKVKICLEYLGNEILNIKPEEYLEKITIGLLQEYKLKIVLSVLYFSIYDMLSSLYPDIYKPTDILDL